MFNFNLTDIINWAIGLFGLYLAWINRPNGDISSKWFVVINVLCAQCILLCMFFVVIRNNKKNKESLKHKDDTIKDYIQVVNSLREQDKLKEERDKEKRELNKNYLDTICKAIKNNSSHNNEMLIKVAAETEKTYTRIIEISENYKTVLKSKDLTTINSARDRLKIDLKMSAENYSAGIFEIYKRYCSDMVQEVKILETAYLRMNGYQDTVSIAVKLFRKPVKRDSFDRHEKNIYTAFRDKDCYNDRDEVGKHKREIGRVLYSVDDNTDFEHCLTAEYFMLNQAKKDSGNYRNGHEDFDRYYNCTVVVPIRVKQTDNQFLFMGYLCCDCKNDNNQQVFDKQCAQYLFVFAQNFATFLQTIDSNWKDRFLDNKDVPDSALEVLYLHTQRTVT